MLLFAPLLRCQRRRRREKAAAATEASFIPRRKRRRRRSETLLTTTTTSLDRVQHCMCACMCLCVCEAESSSSIRFPPAGGGGRRAHEEEGERREEIGFLLFAPSPVVASVVLKGERDIWCIFLLRRLLTRTDLPIRTHRTTRLLRIRERRGQQSPTTLLLPFYCILLLPLRPVSINEKGHIHHAPHEFSFFVPPPSTY